MDVTCRTSLIHLFEEEGSPTWLPNVRSASGHPATQYRSFVSHDLPKVEVVGMLFHKRWMTFLKVDSPPFVEAVPALTQFRKPQAI